MFVRALCLAAAALLAACPDGSTIPRFSGADAGPAKDAAIVTPGPERSGLEQTIFVTESGEETLPFDHSRSTIAAFAEANGDLVRSPGSGMEDGRFVIAGAPEGEIAIQIGPVFLFTESEELDLSVAVLGRSDLVTIRDSTTLVIDAANLVPWQHGDSIEVFSINAGQFFYSSHLYAQNPPQPGATALEDFTLDGLDAYPVGVLIDASKGDRLTITQLSTRMKGEVRYQALARIFTADPFTQLNGTETLIQGTMSEVPQTSTIALEWRRSELEALRAQLNPRAVAQSQQLFVEAQPAGEAHGNFSATPDVLLVEADLGESDLSLGSLSFGNPFPREWPLIAGVIHVYTVAYSLPGARRAMRVPTAIVVQARASELDGVPIVPRVGPVRELKIGGLDAFESPTGVGLTPIVTWSAPELGEPTEYELEVIRLTAFEGETFAEPIAQLRSRSTRMRVPTGVLKEGERYVFKVWAHIAEGQDFDRRPNRSGLGGATAAVLSEIVSP